MNELVNEPGEKTSSSVFTRIAWGIVVGFVVLHGASVLFYNHEKMVSEASTFALSTAERTLSLLAAAQRDPHILELVMSESFSVVAVAEPVAAPARVWPHSGEVRSELVRALKKLGQQRADEVRFWYGVRQGVMSLTLQLPADDGWLLVRATSPGVTGHSFVATFWTTLLGVVILLAVLWTTRRFTRVLPRFADAAERLGRDGSLPALPEQGPKEIRRLGRAFNAMQARVTALLAERNTMLGALSHDVRTLVTRLSLRLDEISDSETRDRAQQDIEAISGILEEALAFSRGEAGGEQRRPVDLPSLLQTLVDDYADRGARITCHGPEALTLLAEPQGLRRAIGNLVDNGIRYGDTVDVRLSAADAEAIVDVIDQGSGIPPADRARVLAPFVRLEDSRNRTTGGSGLGLAIVKSIVARHGGALEFIDAEAGFTARLRLPLPA